MLILAVVIAYVVSIVIEYLLLRKHLPQIASHGVVGWLFLSITAVGAPFFVIHDLFQHFWDKVAKDER